MSDDGWDEFNHPRYRRAMILWELAGRSVYESGTKAGQTRVGFSVPKPPTEETLSRLEFFSVHSNGLLEFLSTAWKKWDALGEEGQDPMSTLKHNLTDDADGETRATPPLIPGNVPLPRDPNQRPSSNVMGEMGFYCTDTCTPFFDELLDEQTDFSLK